MQSCKQHHHTILLVLVCHHQTKLNFYACCFSPTFLEQTFLLSSPHIFLGNGFQWATLLYCSCLYSARFLLLPSFHVVDMLASSFISKAKFNRFFRIMKKYYIIERPSVIPGTSKHEKFNWFMWLYFLHKSVTWASQISWGQKKCLQFWQTKVAIFLFNSCWKLLYELTWISTCLCVTYKCSSIISIYHRKIG